MKLCLRVFLDCNSCPDGHFRDLDRVIGQYGFDLGLVQGF